MRLIILPVLLTLFFQMAVALEIRDYPLINSNRLELIREYNIEHYGYNGTELKDPKIIVVHYTETSTLDQALRYFKSDLMKDDRSYGLSNGRVNVSVHFVVDKGGEIVSCIPLNITARHAIGFNYTAIGIENIALNESGLTDKELESNVEIIKMLTDKFPSIQYLIGHHEYNDTNLPHYQLFKEMKKGYSAGPRHDPGNAFMVKLRKLLKEKYNLVLSK